MPQKRVEKKFKKIMRESFVKQTLIVVVMNETCSTSSARAEHMKHETFTNIAVKE